MTVDEQRAYSNKLSAFLNRHASWENYTPPKPSGQLEFNFNPLPGYTNTQQHGPFVGPGGFVYPPQLHALERYKRKRVNANLYLNQNPVRVRVEYKEGVDSLLAFLENVGIFGEIELYWNDKPHNVSGYVLTPKEAVKRKVKRERAKAGKIAMLVDIALGDDVIDANVRRSLHPKRLQALDEQVSRHKKKYKFTLAKLKRDLTREISQKERAKSADKGANSLHSGMWTNHDIALLLTDGFTTSKGANVPGRPAMEQFLEQEGRNIYHTIGKAAITAVQEQIKKKKGGYITKKVYTGDADLEKAARDIRIQFYDWVMGGNVMPGNSLRTIQQKHGSVPWVHTGNLLNEGLEFRTKRYSTPRISGVNPTTIGQSILIKKG